jgi:hypothetical protein
MKRVALTLILFASISFLKAQNNNEEKLINLEKSAQQQDIATTATLNQASRLFKSSDDLTSVILVIPKGSQVEVIDSDSTYFHVRYEENEGYILRRHASVDKSNAPVTQPRELRQDFPVVEEKPQVQQQDQQNQEVSRFTYLENKYGTSMAARLNSGKIWKGMNAEMIRDSWGRPDKINREINGNTVKEEWIYKTTWLYLEDNTLKDWGPVKQ